MGDAIGLVIDGAVVPGESGTYPVTNPVRPAEVVFDAPSASSGQLDRAVAAARGRLPGLGGDGARGAGRGGGARRRRPPVPPWRPRTWPRLLTREHGKVLWEAQFDVGHHGRAWRAPSPRSWPRRWRGATMSGGGGRTTKVVHEPFGVVAALLPFNWPVSVFGNKVLPALLAGNTVVVKAPPTCPGAVLAVAAALADALPPGVVNAVNGPGPELGEMLVSHPDVDMVSFTGGVPTGRAVMAAASRAVRPVVLELGGNDPAIVAPDMDIDAALADKIAGATFITSGQVCMAIKRLYVPEEKVRDMVDALVARVGAEVVGDGLAPEVTMGPVHLPAARRPCRGHVGGGRGGAGRGSTGPPRCARRTPAPAGTWCRPPSWRGLPTTPRSCARSSSRRRSRCIGYRDVDEAMRRANDSPYGLCASIWTGDEDLAASAARRLEAGTVFVNNHGTAAMDHRAPFGGWKQSGYGLELGPEGMLAFTRPKTVLQFPGIVTA